MASKTESNNGFQQLFADVKEYINLQSDYLQVHIVEKSAKLMSKLLIGGLVLVFLMAGLFYLLFALAYALAPVVGIVASFVIIGCFYLISLAVILLFRKQLIINPLLKLLVDVFYESPEEKIEKIEKEKDENNAATL